MPKYTNSEYDIGKAFSAIENELISSMIRNMDHHRAEETKEGIEWTQWQVEQLKALEKYKVQNQKRYNEQFKDINDQIRVLIRQARDTGSMEQEIVILNAIKNGFSKTMQQSSNALQGEFFKLNERKLEALIEATTHDMKKAETAVLRAANDQYRKAIFNAQVYANSGAGTYEKAVDMATKDMVSDGLKCIEYANGARHTLSDYADMAIRTASKRAYLQGEGEKRKEWGIATVIMNKRGNPCPLCLPFAGKVLIDDVWSGGTKGDGTYPLMSTAIAAGLYHPRCKDSHTTFFSGISTADDTWAKEELEAVGKQNRQEAKNQYAKKQAEKFGRLAAGSLDPQNKKRSQEQETEWINKYEFDLMESATKFASKQEADNYHRENTEKVWGTLTAKEKNALFKYTGSSYSGMNRALRKDTISQAEKSIQEYITNMKSALDKCTLESDVWVRRGVSINGISGLLNTPVDKLKDLNIQSKLIGSECIEKGFMSTGVSSGAGFSGINLEICLPKGSKAIYAEPFSQFGGTNSSGTWDGIQKGSYVGSEAELIIQCGSSFKIKDIKTDSNGYITDIVLLLTKIP